MRVLDPKIKNPMYKLHDRASRAIGDGGVIGTTVLGGVAAPVAAGVFVDTPLSFLSAIGFYGVITFRNYLKNTKSKTRVSFLVNIKKDIPKEYHYVIDPMVSEVYHCNKPHYEFQPGERGFRFDHNIETNREGRVTSMGRSRVSLPRETDEQWEERKQKELLLKHGYGCIYCGARINAAIQLRDECIERVEEDDSTVQNTLAVVESKKFANEAYRGLPSAGYTKIMKELSQ